MKAIVLLIFIVALSYVNAQDIHPTIQKEFAKIETPFKTPKNLPFDTKSTKANLSAYPYLKNEVTAFIKGLGIETEKDSKCYAIGYILFNNKLFIIYLEQFFNPYDQLNEYVIKISGVNPYSEKSLLYLANDYYKDFTDDSGKAYKQHDHLESKVYIKNNQLFVDSKLRLIDDLMLDNVGKLKRTKNTLYKYSNKLIDNEFKEIITY